MKKKSEILIEDLLKGKDFILKELKNKYIDNGYVIVKNVISKNENKEIIDELKKINYGGYKLMGIKPLKNQVNDINPLGRFMYLGQTHSFSKIVRKYIIHKSLTKILDNIVGVNVPFWNGGYKCMQTMFITKKPGGNGSPWHQDEYPIPTRDRSLTGVWIPLEDASIKNSCLWIIPESHKSGILYKRFKHNESDIDSNDIARGFDESTKIPLEMEANSALFFSGYLLHSSQKNLSKNFRPALSIHYCSSSTYLNWNGEKNYRGIVHVKGIDPYKNEGYFNPQPWHKEC